MEPEPDEWEGLIEEGDVPKLWVALGDEPLDWKLGFLMDKDLDLDDLPKEVQEQLLRSESTSLLTYALDLFGERHGDPPNELVMEIIRGATFAELVMALPNIGQEAWGYYSHGPGGEDEWTYRLYLAVVESCDHNCAADVFSDFDSSEQWGKMFCDASPNTYPNRLLIRLVEDLSWHGYGTWPGFSRGEIFLGELIRRLPNAEAMGYLSEKVLDDDFPGQTEICNALVEHNSVALVGTWFALAHLSEEFGETAVANLAYINDVRAQVALEALVRSRDSSVRATAAKGLAGEKGKNVSSLLDELAQDDDAAVAEAAAKSLEWRFKPPVEHVVKARFTVREEGSNPSTAPSIGEFIESHPEMVSITIAGQTFPALDQQPPVESPMAQDKNTRPINGRWQDASPEQKQFSWDELELPNKIKPFKRPVGQEQPGMQTNSAWSVQGQPIAIDRFKVSTEAKQFLEDGKLELALEKFLLLHQDNPQDLSLMNQLTSLYLQLGQIDEGIDLCRRLAHEYEQMGYTGHVIAVLRKAVRSTPNDRELSNLLATAWIKHGDLKEAGLVHLRSLEHCLKQGSVSEVEELLRAITHIVSMLPNGKD